MNYENIYLIIGILTLFDILYFRFNRILLRMTIYLILAGYIVSSMFLKLDSTIPNTTLTGIMLYFALFFPFSRILESEFRHDLIFISRSLLSPFLVLSQVSLSQGIMVLSIISFLSMFHTEVRIRYLVSYFYLAVIFSVKLIDPSYCFYLLVFLLTISILCILVISKSASVERLIEESESRFLIKSTILTGSFISIGYPISLILLNQDYDFFEYTFVLAVFVSLVGLIKVKRI